MQTKVMAFQYPLNDCPLLPTNEHTSHLPFICDRTSLLFATALLFYLRPQFPFICDRTSLLFVTALTFYLLPHFPFICDRTSLLFATAIPFYLWPHFPFICDRTSLYFFCDGTPNRVKWVPFHDIPHSRIRVEKRLAANILNKHLLTAEKRLSSSSGIWRGAKTAPCRCNIEGFGDETWGRETIYKIQV
jgi:hypothetical protein